MPDAPNIPPATIDSDIEAGPDDWQGRAFNYLINALVIPRPIGWISTISEAGVPNLAPYSYFNVMGSDPYYVAFGSIGVKDSLANLREVPQFVANIVTRHILERMNFTSTDFPRHEDEFSWAGLTPVAAAAVRPCRVGEAKAHLECEVVQVVSDRNTHIVLGRIVHAHVDRSVGKDGRIDPLLLDPVARASGPFYAGLGEMINLGRAAWRDVEAKGTEAMPRVEKR